MFDNKEALDQKLATKLTDMVQHLSDRPLKTSLRTKELISQGLERQLSRLSSVPISLEPGPSPIIEGRLFPAYESAQMFTEAYQRYWVSGDDSEFKGDPTVVDAWSGAVVGDPHGRCTGQVLPDWMSKALNWCHARDPPSSTSSLPRQQPLSVKLKKTASLTGLSPAAIVKLSLASFVQGYIAIHCPRCRTDGFACSGDFGNAGTLLVMGDDAARVEVGSGWLWEDVVVSPKVSLVKLLLKTGTDGVDAIARAYLGVASSPDSAGMECELGQFFVFRIYEAATCIIISHCVPMLRATNPQSVPLHVAGFTAHPIINDIFDIEYDNGGESANFCLFLHSKGVEFPYSTAALYIRGVVVRAIDYYEHSRDFAPLLSLVYSLIFHLGSSRYNHFDRITEVCADEQAEDWYGVFDWSYVPGKDMITGVKGGYMARLRWAVDRFKVDSECEFTTTWQGKPGMAAVASCLYELVDAMSAGTKARDVDRVWLKALTIYTELVKCGLDIYNYTTVLESRMLGQVRDPRGMNSGSHKP